MHYTFNSLTVYPYPNSPGVVSRCKYFDQYFCRFCILILEIKGPASREESWPSFRHRFLHSVFIIGLLCLSTFSAFIKWIIVNLPAGYYSVTFSWIVTILGELILIWVHPDIYWICSLLIIEVLYCLYFAFSADITGRWKMRVYHLGLSLSSSN